jgi:hypothetical protein
VQLHYRPLEASDDGRAALLVGLEYLIQISFVNDDEVRVTSIYLGRVAERPLRRAETPIWHRIIFNFAHFYVV